MSWKLAIYDGGVKAHYIPESLYTDITDELFARYLERPFQELEKDEAVYDVGGMAMIDEEWVKWITPHKDLMVSMRARHFPYAFDELRNLKLRHVNGKPYYKLHGWLHCIVLTPSQRDYLLTEWKGELCQFNEKALVGNVEFARRLAEINKHEQVIISLPKVDIPKDKD